MFSLAISDSAGQIGQISHFLWAILVARLRWMKKIALPGK